MRDLFLCHTGADKEWVKAFGARLESESVDGHSLTVWLDEWDIEHGKSIISAIGDGLKESRFVAVILSPAMVSAPWPTAEWQSLVADDPLNKHGKILPVLRHKYDPFTGSAIEIPWILKPLKRFDFTEEKRFEGEYTRLLRHLRGLKPERGLSHSRGHRLGASIGTLSLGNDSPDEVQEALFGNMFPVSALPAVIHSDFTTAADYPDVWKEFEGTETPPFYLHGGRLFSFYPATANNPFKKFLSGLGGTSQPTDTLLRDSDLSRKLIGLLNAALRNHCWKLQVRTVKKDRTQFYCPVVGTKQRLFAWGPKGRKRTLAKLIKGPGGGAFGVHHAARMRFALIGDRLRLIVEPGWMFTTDGVEPIQGLAAGVLSTKWGGRERNAGVFRNVLMWGLLLSKGQRSFALSLGGADAMIETLPVLADIGSGIEGDQIRIDRMLAGTGTGEVGVTAPADEELDLVARVAMSGIGDPERPDSTDERLGDETESQQELF